MVRSIVFAAALLVVLSGCASMRAPSRQGLNAMENGRCDEAIRIMEGPAAQGDGYSLNNLGTIAEKGCPATGWPADPSRAFEYYRDAATRGVPIAFSNAGALIEFGWLPIGKDPDAAARLYQEGARYGDPNSVTGLKRLGRPVPAVDRMAPDIAERKQKQLEFALMAVSLAAGVSPPVGSSQPPSPRPTYRTVAPFTTASATGTCRNTVDCGVGQRCVVPIGQVSGIGMCVTPTAAGMPAILPPKLAADNVASCQFDTQCPQRFHCQRVNPGDLHGLCVGPQSAQFFH